MSPMRPAPASWSVNLTGALPDANRPHHPVYDVIADTSRFPKQQPAPVQPAQQTYTAGPVTPVVPQAPLAAQPAQQRPDFDVDLGPAASDSARLKAQTHDPLEPVNIGPGGTFGMDPLSNKTSTTFHYAQQTQPAPAPAPSVSTEKIASEISDNLEKLIGSEPETKTVSTPAPAKPAARPMHPESATIKFEDLKFGRNYDPTSSK